MFCDAAIMSLSLQNTAAANYFLFSFLFMPLWWWDEMFRWHVLCNNCSTFAWHLLKIGAHGPIIKEEVRDCGSFCITSLLLQLDLMEGKPRRD